MHTVALLDEALALAERIGYKVRHESLGGSGGGGCELKGRKWFFFDLDLGPTDQLERVLETLRRDPGVEPLPMSHQMRDLLQVRKSA